VIYYYVKYAKYALRAAMPCRDDAEVMIAMGLWLKGCPKCGGDLYNDRDVMGYYRQCLQCGYTFYEQRRRPAEVSSSVSQRDEGGGTGEPEPKLSEAA
jgi:hypothetical protein